MATINYCDFATGDDSTGNGSASTPYKTITKASTGLTGNDEVRVAKSPDNTTLTGTIGFTEGSTTLTGSGTSFTTELVIGDFVLGGDNVPYEVITITNNTTAVLYKAYPSSTQSGITAYKVGMTSTGAAAASTTQIQVVSASGTSTSARLKISGGWDLATEQQTGVSNFKQMHGTFATRNGYGLYASNKNYFIIEKCSFHRYNYGIYFTNSSSNTITTPTCNSNNYGIYFNSSSSNTITTPTCNTNNNYGIYFTNSSSNTITTPTCNSNSYGINFNSSSNNNTITTPTCNSNSYGILISSSSNNNTITTPTCNTNTTNAFYTDNSFGNIVNKFSGTGNVDVTQGSTVPILEISSLSIQWYNAKGTNKNWFYQGITESNTAEADGGSGTCLHYAPSSATLYMSHSFLFKAVDNTAYTITAKVKKKDSFNGDVQGAVFFLGVPVIDWTDITPTNADAYETKTFNVTQAMVIDNSCLELRIKVRGTAGDIYVDTLGIS